MYIFLWSSLYFFLYLTLGIYDKILIDWDLGKAVCFVDLGFASGTSTVSGVNYVLIIQQAKKWRYNTYKLMPLINKKQLSTAPVCMQSNEKSLGFQIHCWFEKYQINNAYWKVVARITLVRALSKAKYIGKRRVQPAYYIIRMNHMVHGDLILCLPSLSGIVSSQHWKSLTHAVL